MNAIRTDKLSKNLRIKNISFELPQGTVMGLIGENGAGKSTLIKIITGMAKADSGTVEILGCSDKNDMVNIRPVSYTHLDPNQSSICIRHYLGLFHMRLYIHFL